MGWCWRLRHLTAVLGRLVGAEPNPRESMAFLNGKMAIMSGITVEQKAGKQIRLDKAGRVVVPKSIRDALRLRAGEPLKVEQRNEEIVIRRDQPNVRLENVDGWLVIRGGPPRDYSIPDLIDEIRNERIRELGGE